MVLERLTTSWNHKFSFSLLLASVVVWVLVSSGRLHSSPLVANSFRSNTSGFSVLKGFNGSTRQRTLLASSTGKLSGSKSDSISKENRNNISGNILLLGYLRGGTTFASGILQRIPNAFYSFEPLRYQLRKPLGTEDYFSAHGICSFISGRCRYQDPGDWNSQTSPVTKRIITLFKKFYDCDLERLPEKFSWRRKQDTDQQLRSCLKPNVTTCAFLKQLCKSSPARIIKTVRLSFDLVEPLIMDIPNLKVIYLLRDPRGLLHSRQRTNFIDRTNAQLLLNHLKSDCKRILNDIRSYLQAHEKFPNKVKVFFYENLAMDPATESQKLFDFLETKPGDNFATWLKNVTQSGRYDSEFGIARPLSKESALRWRREMSFGLAKKVDKTRECVQVYNLIGLTTLSTEAKMRNIGMSLVTGRGGIFPTVTDYAVPRDGKS